MAIDKGLQATLLQGQSAYKPLSEVRQQLNVKFYRCPVDVDTFQKLSQRSDKEGFFLALGHLALLIITGTVVFWTWSRQQWFAMLVALWLHGTIASMLTFATHELAHGTVFHTRWLNQMFLYLFSLLNWRFWVDYKVSHTFHHRYTQYPEADRENLSPVQPSLSPKLMLQMFTFNLFTTPGRNFGTGGLFSTINLTVRSACGMDFGSADEVPFFEWIKALHTDQPEEAVNAMWWSRAMLFFHGSIFVLAVVKGWYVLPLIFSTSAFTASWLKYFVGATQHTGLQNNVPDFRKTTRTVTLDPFTEFLYWHMNWHIEHHMFVSMPCYNLRKLHDAVAHDMPVPRTLLEAWREMRETWQKQQEDPTYEFDTPMPATAGSDVTPACMLGSSMGDLAPEKMQDQA